MDRIDRRNMLIGSGLTLAMSGLEPVRLGRVRRTEFEPLLAPSSFEDGWTHGDRPWDPHPGNPTSFNPTHSAVLHLEFTSAGLKAQRIHFASTAGTNDWSGNKSKVISFINFLNNPGQSSPGLHHVFPGLKNFAFDRPHHFIVYVKNPGVDYIPGRPVWFGKKLIRDVFGVKVASKNESFFGAMRDDGPITGGSTNLVYMKNYYHVGNGSGNGQGHRSIRRNERLAYALKINALMPSVEDPTYKVPLIIDPDTGNMGEGQPVPPNASPGNVPNRN